MPRDSTETRSRLLEVAERRFAQRGIWQAPIREIVEEAGQRNSSALNYHFGSREGMLDTILREHGEPIDRARGERLAMLDDDAPTGAVVEALVRPMTAQLDDDRGRNYLRIVAQLAAQLSETALETTYVEDYPHLMRALLLLGERPVQLPATVRQERVLSLVMLMTVSLAERARRVEDGRPLGLDAEGYATNLTDMLVGIIDAPTTENSQVGLPVR